MRESCGAVAIVVGERPPAMSISWERPVRPWDSGYCVIYSELDPDDDNDPTPSQLVCLHCLLEDDDAELGRGLDLARRHGQVDFDVQAGEWFPASKLGRGCEAADS